MPDKGSFQPANARPDLPSSAGAPVGTAGLSSPAVVVEIEAIAAAR